MFPNIAKELVRNGFKLVDLAQKIGMSKTALYDRYTGRVVFSLPDAIKIKEALGSEMTIEELFWKVEE